jgi:chromatin assembly factor 1 subunit B
MSLGIKNATLYTGETLASFFRRLTFTPDGALLLTPSGQYQTQNPSDKDTKDGKTTYEVINTVYIYTRGGINKPPVAHLPGHKKASVVVRCSPIFYMVRTSPPVTKHITIDTSSDDPMPLLPEPVARPTPPPPAMEPPPPPSTSTISEPTSAPQPKASAGETEAAAPGPKPTFSLPYRMVYAVATQDSVLLYDTQQQTPICIVSNLHCATFTDLAW